MSEQGSYDWREARRAMPFEAVEMNEATTERYQNKFLVSPSDIND